MVPLKHPGSSKVEAQGVWIWKEPVHQLGSIFRPWGKNLREAAYPQNRPTHFQKPMTYPQNLPTHLQKPRTAPQNLPTHFQKPMTYPQNLPTHFQKPMTYPQNRPTHFQKPENRVLGISFSTRLCTTKCMIHVRSQDDA